MEFTIENDVGIICLKCVCIVLKVFRWCEFYYIKYKHYTMFILILVDPKQINVTYSYGSI
jgi:hypothetical protein